MTSRFISFVDSHGKTITYSNVLDVEHCAADTKNRKKADMIIRCQDQEIPVSIKADNAECWESGDRIMGEKFAELAKQIPKEMLTKNTDGTYRLSAPVACRANRETAMNAAFGSDITSGNGIVIRRSFSQDDISQDDKGNIEVRVSHIAESLADLKDDVWIILRNDRTRNSKHLPKGIRGLVCTKKRVTSNSYVVKDLYI